MSLRSQPNPAHTQGNIQYHSKTLDLETEESPAFIKITSPVKEVIRQSGINNGQVFVFSKHTTAGITIQEDEPLLLDDFESFLEDLAPEDGGYRHNDFEIRTVNLQEEESENGHSHCRHLTIGPSETLPIHDGQMVTGEWQDIFLLELDGPREREIFVQTSGTSA